MPKRKSLPKIAPVNVSVTNSTTVDLSSVSRSVDNLSGAVMEGLSSLNENLSNSLNEGFAGLGDKLEHVLLDVNIGLYDKLDEHHATLVAQQEILQQQKDSQESRADKLIELQTADQEFRSRKAIADEEAKMEQRIQADPLAQMNLILGEIRDLIKQGGLGREVQKDGIVPDILKRFFPNIGGPTTKAPTTKAPGGPSKLGSGLKLGGKLLGGAGLALGAYEASEFLGETGYGDKMKEGAGKRAEKAFRENVAPTIDPIKAGVTKEQAIAALENGTPRDIQKLGGRDALMVISGKAPSNLPAQADYSNEGRTRQAPAPAATPTAAPAATPTAAAPSKPPSLSITPAALPSSVKGGGPSTPPPAATPPAPAASTGTGLKPPTTPPSGAPGLKPKISISGDADIKAMIKKHEGVRYQPYKDSLGLWTVGVGHLIGDGKSLPPEWNRTFSPAEVDALFEEDYAHHKKAAQGIPGFSKLNNYGQGALTDLTFNMGPAWYKKWPMFTKQVQAGDTAGAADNLQSSKWFGQVGNRGPAIVSLMRAGGEGGAMSPALETPRGQKDASVTEGAVQTASGGNMVSGSGAPVMTGSAPQATPVSQPPKMAAAEPSTTPGQLPSSITGANPIASAQSSNIGNLSEKASTQVAQAPVIINNNSSTNTNVGGGGGKGGIPSPYGNRGSLSTATTFNVGSA